MTRDESNGHVIEGTGREMEGMGCMVTPARGLPCSPFPDLFARRPLFPKGRGGKGGEHRRGIGERKGEWGVTGAPFNLLPPGAADVSGLTFRLER